MPPISWVHALNVGNISPVDNVDKLLRYFTSNSRHLYRHIAVSCGQTQSQQITDITPFLLLVSRSTENLLDRDILTRHRDVHSFVKIKWSRRDVKQTSQFSLLPVVAVCMTPRLLRPVLYSFETLALESGEIRIQFSFHHIWFQSTVDYTQNIQDQDRICIKLEK